MLSIIIPVYNGTNNIKPVLSRIKSAVIPIDEDIEIIFVDDKSTDGTLDEIHRQCRTDSKQKIQTGWISLKENKGQQIAVLCGLRNCRGDFAVTIDDDLEHPPELIPILYSQIKKRQIDGLYAAAESDKNNKRSFFLSTGSFLRDVFFLIFTGKPRGLKISSYRIFSREAINKIIKTEKPYVYISAEFFKNGFQAEHIFYKTRQGRIPGRYSSAARILLYLRLIRWYAIGIDFSRNRLQYEIEEKGGII